jgi:hypothetical protein
VAREIKFSDFKQVHDEYEKSLKAIRHEMAMVAHSLRNHCFTLAMMKVWKRWDESIPAGTVMEFHDGMFLECGDENVVQLMSIAREIETFCGVGDKTSSPGGGED